jgi:hypothetical protein
LEKHREIVRNSSDCYHLERYHGTSGGDCALRQDAHRNQSSALY